MQILLLIIIIILLIIIVFKVKGKKIKQDKHSKDKIKI